MSKKVKGKIEAVSMKRFGVKLDDKWYTFNEKLKGFFEDSKGRTVELSLDDNDNVVYVKFVSEKPEPKLQFADNQINAILGELEEININIITLNQKMQSLIDILYKLNKDALDETDFEEPKAK